MKKFFMVMALVFIAGCGAETASNSIEYSPAPQYGPEDVVWSGYADEKSEYLELYNRVEDCVGQAAPIPKVTVLADEMLVCGKDGCFYADGMTQMASDGTRTWGVQVFVWRTAMTFGYGRVLAHEFVHYVTGKGNELHGGELMKTCGMMQLDF